MNFDNPAAFKPFSQPVVWRQDAAPHMRGTFAAIVLQGESQSQSAGPSVDGILADPWNVFVPLTTAIIAHVKIGDTLTIGPAGAETELTVQQITRTAYDYVIRCTANERAPSA